VLAEPPANDHVLASLPAACSGEADTQIPGRRDHRRRAVVHFHCDLGIDNTHIWGWYVGHVLEVTA
jgi:hypothetical protein